jgi:serpin B
VLAACGSQPSADPSPPTAGTATRDTPSDDTVSDDTVSDDTVSDDTVSDDTVSDDTAAVALPLRYGTVTERSVDGGADGRNATAAVDGINDFAVDLYRAVAAGDDGNTIVGPYSAAFALSMIYAGAGGQTATEIAAVLHADGVEPADWHEGINAYDLTLDARTAGSPTDWNSVNKVWIRPGLPVRDEYLDTLTGDYGSPVAELDFGRAPEDTRALVNGWVDDETAGLIPDLFPTGSFGADTRMVLVNAVAMDAPWEFPFDPSATAPGAFTRADGTAVEVPMMHYDEYLPSLWSEDVQAVELPYGDGALSMVVIVPTDFASFEAELTTESLTGVIDRIQDGGIHLSIPTWTARTHVQLNDTLAELGMPTAFTGAADFSGMIDGGGLYVDQVEHEAVIEVDEEGTRAAAATGGEMAASHGPTISVDRPYLYVIRDRGAGTILFIGRVVDPTVAAT